MVPNEVLRGGDGILVIDVQVDFCPGGKLAIDKGDEVIPLLNQWIEAARERRIPIYLSRDWHPVAHVSFKDAGGMWPPHCVQDTPGAEWHPYLKVPPDAVKVTKGVRFDHDQNSVFDETGLADRLHDDGVTRLWVGGLALDVCVLKSVLDGLTSGFEVHLLADGTRPVNAEEGQKALTTMSEAGAVIER